VGKEKAAFQGGSSHQSGGSSQSKIADAIECRTKQIAQIKTIKRNNPRSIVM
jgi:hypothetical protein